MTYDDLQLIEQFNRMSDYVAQQEGALKDKLAKVKEGMEGIKAELMRRMIERKTSNSKTKAGTAYLGERLNHKVVKPIDFTRWVSADWPERAALMVIKPPTDEIRDYMALNKGAVPPGVQLDPPTTYCNIRRNGA